jgi:thiamine biosynthesis lipoprotein
MSVNVNKTKGKSGCSFCAPGASKHFTASLCKFPAHFKHLVLVLFLLQAATAAVKTDLLRLEASAETMGSVYSLVLYDEDRNKMESAADDAFDEARRLDALLSNYRPESEWSKINREAAAHPVAVSKELFDLLAACVQYSRSSEGAFDITVGPLMKVWGFYKGTGHLPQPGEVKHALAQMGYTSLILNASAHTVAFAKSGMDLDPGGVGKGYAVDKMVEILKKDGIQTALVSGGGSSIYGLGAPPDQPGWKIQIKNPYNEFQHVADVTLKNESLSTSGSYEKFFVAEGKTWSHIMDPRTGFPSQGTLSVSVIAPRTLDSEVWAKPYFINGRLWTALHKPREFRVFFCSADGSTPAETDPGFASAKSADKDKAEQKCAWLP